MRDRREYHAQRRRERKDSLDSVKLARGCCDCGYDLAPEALDFDHRDPTEKSFGLSRTTEHSWEETLAEVAKCDVRCANCHRIRTKRQWSS